MEIRKRYEEGSRKNDENCGNCLQYCNAAAAIIQQVPLQRIEQPETFQECNRVYENNVFIYKKDAFTQVRVQLNRR